MRILLIFILFICFLFTYLFVYFIILSTRPDPSPAFAGLVVNVFFFPLFSRYIMYSLCCVAHHISPAQGSRPEPELDPTTTAAPTRAAARGKTVAAVMRHACPGPEGSEAEGGHLRCGGGGGCGVSGPDEPEGVNDQRSAQGRDDSDSSVVGPDQGGGPDPDGSEGGSERAYMVGGDDVGGSVSPTSGDN
jgi:hypothetical protein